MQNTYQIINASAGSGKTYALVQRLLMLCLRFPNQHYLIGNILALTFTNKAANEMKERILSWLGKFSQGNYAENSDLENLQKALKEEKIYVDIDELHNRSKELLDYILHNYSILNIGTIDRFNSRLVRSFSHELGLAKNFNLEIDPEPYLIEAVDKILDQVGENSTFSDTFLDYVNYSLDNNERITLNQNLYQSAKEFVKDIHYQNLKENDSFNETNYEKIKSTFRNDIKNIREKSLTLLTESLQLIQDNDIEIEDFAQGKNGLGGFFSKALDFYEKRRNDFPIPGNEENAQNTFLKGASAKGKLKEDKILDVVSILVENRQKIIQNYIEGIKKQKVLSALLPLKVNKDIQNELKKIEEENDLVLLSKFNILINENLKNEPSAFIYEKVGTKFMHYFFDEFQDTSELQWQNFVPLRDHTLASENTSFTLVGDPKQSIYRFRGGESQLMLNILNGNEKINQNAQVITLKDNWRSAKNIVQFNNELYQYLSGYLNEEHQHIFGSSGTQNAMSNIEGRVKINIVENSTQENFYLDVCERMKKDIQECINNGFSLSDITILCRGNTDIFHFSQKLGSLTIEYKGKTTNIKTLSEKGLTLDLSSTIKALIEFLKWYLNPKNTPHLILMMYYLNETGRIYMQDFTLEITKILDLKNYQDILNYLKSDYGLNVEHETFPKFNLYNFVEYYVNEFSVKDKETDFLLNFLELLYNYTQTSGAGLKDFVQFWDEEASQKSILASENIDAVQIMTIHKAKGLEFPVVFIPMRNTSRDSQFNNWFETENLSVLKSVNIGNFGKELEVYDNQINKFNKENTYKNFLDRMCLQYVATTRPVEQLFFYLQKENKTTNHLEILDFLKTKNVSDDEFDIYPTPPEVLKKQHQYSISELETKNISHFQNYIEKETYIKIATPSKNYQTRNEKVKNGIFVHELLSKIVTEKDIKNNIETYLLEGIITNEESMKIEKNIFDIVQKYSYYFSENWEIINEKEIMISENGVSKIYRPDRILKNADDYIIVDFKTGDPDPKHEKQIKLYKDILEKLGKKVVKTELIYF